MPQHLLDEDRGNASGHHVRGRRVAERVGSGANIEPGLFPIVGHQLLDGADRQRAVAAVLEERRGRRGGQAASGVEGEQLADAGLGFVVERHHAAARPFADGRGQVKKLPGRAIVRDEVNDEPRAFPASFLALPFRSAARTCLSSDLDRANMDESLLNFGLMGLDQRLRGPAVKGGVPPRTSRSSVAAHL